MSNESNPRQGRPAKRKTLHVPAGKGGKSPAGDAPREAEQGGQESSEQDSLPAERPDGEGADRP